MRGLYRLKNRNLDRLNLAPEIRLGLAFVASLAALIVSAPMAIGVLLAASAVYTLPQVRLKTITLAYLFFGVMAIIAVAFAWLMGFVFEAMKENSLNLVLTPFARLAISLNMILPLALFASLPGLVNTLNRVGMPGVIKLPLIVTIRFIPYFFNDFVQLRQAVRLRFRGRAGFCFWLRQPFLWGRVFFMPLVIRLIRSADELAVASELKGLSAETDFGRPNLVLSGRDRMALVLGAAVVLASFLIQALYAGS